MDPKQLQQKYMEFQMIGQNIQQLQQQMATAEQQKMEIAAILENLGEFSEIEDKKEILVPLHNGLFVKANLKKEDKILVNIGTSVMAEKTIGQTKEFINNQGKEIDTVITKIEERITQLGEKAADIEKELKELQSQ